MGACTGSERVEGGRDGRIAWSVISGGGRHRAARFDDARSEVHQQAIERVGN